MILERIRVFIDKQGLTVAAFERSIGMSNASFAKSLKKGGAIGTDKLENILKTYPQLSPEWLLTGRGEMLKSDDAAKMYPVDEPVDSGDKVSESIPNVQDSSRKGAVAIPTDSPQEGIPLIPIDAMAGALSGEQTVLEYECERYVVPAFRGAHFLIRVKGSSMYPTYSSGDIVACQKVPMTDLFFQWNKVYVIDTDQGALIKRIKPGSDRKHISIVSDNPDYDPFELPYSSIHAVALVIGVIRLE